MRNGETEKHTSNSAEGMAKLTNLFLAEAKAHVSLRSSLQRLAHVEARLLKATEQKMVDIVTQEERIN